MFIHNLTSISVDTELSLGAQIRWLFDGGLLKAKKMMARVEGLNMRTDGERIQ